MASLCWISLPMFMLFILLVFMPVVSSQSNLDTKTAFIGIPFKYTCPGDLANNTFSFTKHGQPITPGSGVFTDKNNLTIPSPKLGDGGSYYCKREPKPGFPGKEENIQILIFVRRGIQYTFIIAPKTVAIPVLRGEPFKFKCVYAVPGKTLGWEKFAVGDSAFVQIPRSRITAIEKDSETVEELRFEKVTLNDTGTYKCTVQESAKKRETSSRILQVRDYEAPMFHKDIPPVHLDEGERLDVELNFVGRPYPSLTCFRQGRQIIVCKKSFDVCINGDYELTRNYALVVEEVYYQQNDGEYTCVATNPGGSANITFNVTISVAPKITATAPYIFESKGEPGTVNCSISIADPAPKVTWYTQVMGSNQHKPKEDLWIPSKLQSRLVSYGDGRYRSKLSVPAKQPQAFYMCNASNEVGSDRRVYRFLRQGKGEEPISITTQVKLTLSEDDEFSVMCRVTVSVGGAIFFRRQNLNQVLKNSTRTEITLRQDDTFRYLTLTIPSLWINDSGIYQCTTELLGNRTVSVLLTVKALRPAAILGLDNKTAAYPEDDSVVMFCNVSGNPPPQVSWSFRGRQLKPSKLDAAPVCDQFESGYYYNTQSRLFVCKPRAHHSGRYTCFAENDQRKENRSASLYVSAPPRIRTSFQKKILQVGMGFKVECKATGNPPPFVYWIKNDEAKPMSNQSTEVSVLIIDSMVVSHIGNYTCIASNNRKTIKKHLLELEMISETTSVASTGGMSTGAITGLAIGIVAVLVIVILLVFLWYRKQQRKLLFYKHQYFLKTGEYMVDPSRTLNEQSLNLPYDADWEFPFERLVLGDRLGAGAFGEVYKAEAMGILALNARDKSTDATKRRSKLRRSLRASQRPKKKQAIPGPEVANAVVAVKTLKAGATENEIRDLAAELKLMIHLGEHKNIVNLLGACTTGRTLYVILEFCPHGNLLTFLRSKRDLYQANWIKEMFDPEKEFTLIDLVGAAFQVAKGMEFLAGRKLIHRDLAARNILVGEEYVMKISDFGLARDIYKDDIYVKKSSGLLPIKWMAMESLFERTYTHQSDVWSFGVLFWEMMTLGGTPYPGLPPEELLDFLNNDKRMPQPAQCPLEVYTIMRDCWNKDPELRPTFSGLVDHLGRILEKRLEKENPYLQIAASAEEVEAANEKELLVKQKSDYYLQPLLLATKQKYDTSAPLPTPPADSPTSVKDVPELDTKPGALQNSKGGSYALLKEDNEDPIDGADSSRASLGNESGIGLDYVNSKNNDEKPERKDSTDRAETVV